MIDSGHPWSSGFTRKQSRRPNRQSCIFEDIGFDPEEAAVLKIKADLQIDLEHEIKRRKLTQGWAAKLLGIIRPGLNAILKGHLDSVSIDKLVKLHTRLGGELVIEVKKPQKRRKTVKRRVAKAATDRT